MKAKFCVSILTLIFCIAKATTDPLVSEVTMNPSEYGAVYKTVSKKWHDDCIDITGATEDQIEMLRAGNFINDEKIKRYILCQWKVSGVMGKNMELNEELLDSDLPPVDQKIYSHKALKKCFDDAKNSGLKELVDITYKVEECLYKLNPQIWPVVTNGVAGLGTEQKITFQRGPICKVSYIDSSKGIPFGLEGEDGQMYTTHPILS